MNQFTLLVIILVVFTYYGGSNVPKVLKDNKELLLGVVGGLVLCSFLGMRLEGMDSSVACEEFKDMACPIRSAFTQICKAAGAHDGAQFLGGDGAIANRMKSMPLFSQCCGKCPSDYAGER